MVKKIIKQKERSMIKSKTLDKRGVRKTKAGALKGFKR